MVSLEEAFYTNNSFLGPNVDLEGSSNFIDDDEDYNDLFYEDDSTPKTPEDIQNLFNRNPSSGPPSDPPGVSGDLGIPNLRPDGPPIREISPSSQEINEPAEVIVSRVLFALLISASLVINL